MFEDFLIEHIKDYIKCNDTKYNITDEDIEDIASSICDNESIWETIYMAIDLELKKYEVE